MDTVFLRKIAKYVLISLLSLLAIIYLIYHLFRNFYEGYQTELAEISTVYESITLDAYVFRSERVVTSSLGMDLNYLFENGDKVSKGAHIADVYSGGNGALTERIIEIDKKISMLESCNRQKYETVSDVQVIDSKINLLFGTMLQKTESDDLEFAVREKNALLELLNRRQIVVRAVDDFSEQIEQLRRERNELSSGLSNIVESLYAPVSGYFYTSVDGYESIFDAGVIDSLDFSVFDAMVSASPAANLNAAAKIVTDYRWYLVCEISPVQNRYFSVGSSYSVYYPYSSCKLEMTLFKTISSADADRVMLIFSTDVIPEDLTFYRSQEVEIFQYEYKGYRVPVSSVRLIDGETGVYVLNGNVVRFRKVNPLIEKNGYYIVSVQPTWMEDPNYRSWLGLYDRIITKGTGLFDGKIVDS